MFSSLHDSLKRLLREKGQFEALDIDVTFEIPNRAWASTLTKPTINFFLHDLEENATLRKTNFAAPVTTGHTTSIKQAARRINLRYQVSVFSSEARDQNELLWRTMTVLLRYFEIPPEILPRNIAELGIPVSARVSQPEDGPRSNDLWNGLELPPRPALLYLLTVPLDLQRTLEAPLILSRNLMLQNIPDKSSAGQQLSIGGVVTNSLGEPQPNIQIWRENSSMAGTLTNEIGQYQLNHIPNGQLMLRIAAADQPNQQVMLTIPSATYDIVMLEPNQPEKVFEDQS
jgi:Pvc16 N-terminal domain